MVATTSSTETAFNPLSNLNSSPLLRSLSTAERHRAKFELQKAKGSVVVTATTNDGPMRARVFGDVHFELTLRAMYCGLSIAD